MQLAAEEGAVDNFHAGLTAFAAVLAGNPDLRAILVSPAHRVEVKQEIVRDLLARLALPTTPANFLHLLVDRNRLGYLSQIIASYGALADDLSGVVRPTLTSAMPLDDRQVEGIKGALAKSTGKKVVLTMEVDPSLIGGGVTKIGDKVFDGSVKTQLTRIEDILQKG